MATRTTTAYVLSDAAAETSTTTEVQIPAGARFLCAFVDANRRVGLWFEVMDDVKLQTRRFEVVPTGQPVRTAWRYVDSVHSVRGFWGDEVLHVYEVQDDPDHKLDVRPFAEGQAWAECSCGWKSSLQHTAAAAEAAWDDHYDDVAG